MPYIPRDDLLKALPLPDVIDALELGFAARPTAPVRSHLDVGDAELLLMPAWGEIGVGVKLVTLEPSNLTRGLPLIHGVFVLFAPDTKAPLAVIDGAALTSLRTAAVSALGARHLARDDASRLLIFGAGAQGRAHLEAMCAVRDLAWVAIVDPDAGSAKALASFAEELGLQAQIGCPEDAGDADIICCCTTSRVPVVRGALLTPGTHVAAIGAYRPDMRELDSEALRRSRVIVEAREAVLAEAGDLLIPIERGEWSADLIVGELSDVASGSVRREHADEITVLKTVGLASSDLIVAHAAAEKLGVTAQQAA